MSAARVCLTSRYGADTCQGIVVLVNDKVGPVRVGIDRQRRTNLGTGCHLCQRLPTSRHTVCRFVDKSDAGV